MAFAEDEGEDEGDEEGYVSATSVSPEPATASARVSHLLDRYAASSPADSPVPSGQVEAEEEQAEEEGSWDVDTSQDDGAPAEASFEVVAPDGGKGAVIPFSEWLKASGAEEEAVHVHTEPAAAARDRAVPFSEWLRAQEGGGAEDLEVVEGEAEEDGPIAVEPMPKQAMPFSEWLKMQDAA
mmetsp:Transcript_7809/g.20169  ORF Transcript_7809/g.20169 Transcript_7809/m.20169 type:complete len:182 (-) Transcript_7809:78-623(-)